MTENDPTRQILLTPGPLTTAEATRQAMLRDWGSRDGAFIAMTARVRGRLTALANGTETHVCVPVQGSGTFAVEATIGTLVSRETSKALLLVNGAYGKRIVRICEIAGRAHSVYQTAEDTPPDPAQVARLLAEDAALTHVVLVHCETTSGILNPLEEIARVVEAAGRRLIVDAMSSFGALPINLSEIKAEAIIASANKCLEGTPGLGYAIIERQALAAARGNAHALSLDLFDQYEYMERTGQWRFTPPTHVLAALDAALEAHAAEGGVTARGARYTGNCLVLVDGLRALGFETFLPDALQAPIIVTIRMPADPNFDFATLYDALNDQGIVLYPGAVTQEKSFRIGCIGQVFNGDMRRTVNAIEAALADMGVSQDGLRPAA
jgi:2-aminoethylphosphonate-pyruvate transaminase